ncbi:MAG: DUF1592 domain-containing protein [Pirellulaceae bacterium]|nr:DUF1592 domain-containing protein [Pirellulaceae bacterium]
MSRRIIVSWSICRLRRRRSLYQAAALAATLLLAGWPAEQLLAQEQAAEPAPSRFAQHGVAFIQQHCLDCHSGNQPEAGLSLADVRDDAGVVKNWKQWENVLRMVSLGVMPPDDHPQPKVEQREAFVATLKGVFEQAARDAPPNPGRVTMRRLNRTEYRLTVRDLVGVDFDPTEDFPSDDIGHGFDNIGDVLSLSPVLMERYLAAAESIMQRAIVPDPPPPPKRHLSSRYTEPASANVPLDGNFRVVTSGDAESPVDTGPIHTTYQWDAEGEYTFRARVYADKAGRESLRVAVLVTGQVPDAAGDEEVAHLAGKAVGSLRPLRVLQTLDVKADRADAAEVLEVLVPAMPGRQRMALAIVKPDDDLPPARLFVEYLALEGPLDTRPAAQRRLLAADDGLSDAERSRSVLRRFASRAYRRPVTDEELARLVALADSVQQAGQPWEAAMQLAMQAVLCSPKFLFRMELDGRPESTEIRPLDEFQLASRLSYFLWSTMPDERLFELAGQGRLREQLDAEVHRMLADPKAIALVDNFALQWLQLRRLDTFQPDPQRFPAFSDKLRLAMREETRQFFAAVLREDRPVLDLLDADFTFLNETLARHYGIVDTVGTRPGAKPAAAGGQPIRGDDFVRVQLADAQRGGLVTHASVLTVTSNPTRTSPVKRGRWVLEQILGTPPPAPPANVPELAENEQAQLTGSLRQRMEQHRQNPSCANCHLQMDALGFALENFDPIGGYRTQDGNFPIDAAGTLPDGTAFDGPADLKRVLRQRRELFARCLAEKLLVYALGRGLEYYDTRALDKIVQDLQAADYRFSSLVVAIARSEPFGKRRG